MTPFSHRNDRFKRMYGETVSMLLQHSKSKYVVMLMGSGTAANAMAAQELKKLPGKGLILANGEFGSRLITQAGKVGLSFDTYSVAWGQHFNFDEVKAALHGKGWVWFVHCETSTGALNQDERLLDYCNAENIKVCLDSVSAAGNLPINFSGVYLASSTSGKGFGSFPGIGILYYNHTPELCSGGHDYLDLAAYHDSGSVPFTFSSNLLSALHTALATTDYAEKYARNAEFALYLKNWLHKHELSTPVTGLQADYIWTIACKSGANSTRLGSSLEEKNVLVHYKSHYLLSNNWVQLALMGECQTKQLQTCLQYFEEEMVR